MKHLALSGLVLLFAVTSQAQAPAKAQPDRLINLRSNYERAIERVSAPVSAQYRDELQKMKIEYTKAGNLEAALAVDEELKARFTPPPPLTKSVGAPTVGELAKVNVAPSVIAPLLKGQKLYTESEYVWVDIPEAYAGMQFAQPKHKHIAVTSFSVESDGLVYVAFTSNWEDEDGNKKDDIISRKDVERMGWKPLKAKKNLVSDESGYEWIVCAKQCKAGESFKLRTTKSCAPIVLIR